MFITTRRATRLTLPLAIIAAALTITACDEDPTAPAMVAANDITVGVNAGVANTLANTPFSFPGGAGALDPVVANQNMTLTFGGTDAAPTATMVITSPAGAAVGTITANVSFGSCIFVVGASNFPAGHRLAVGQTITVNPCNIRVNTTSQPADGEARPRPITLVLGTTSSGGQSANVTVTSSGQVLVNGRLVGTVSTTPVSG